MGKGRTIDRRPEACETCWLGECVLILSPAAGCRREDARTVLQLFARPDLAPLSSEISRR